MYCISPIDTYRHKRLYIGIVANLITFCVIVHKSSRTILKENQYSDMAFNALIANSCILFIEIMSLISECQDEFGIFCSSIHRWKFSKYFKIIFCEYMPNCLRLVSNFTYFRFAINRISLVGKIYGNLAMYVSKLTIKGFKLRLV